LARKRIQNFINSETIEKINNYFLKGYMTFVKEAKL
jgi:hypothetical protein